MASTFQFYNLFKKYVANGTIQLGTDVLRMQLHTSASNASTFTLSTAASVNNEVANGNGYTTGGKSLTSVTWTVGASAKEYRLDAADLVWTATGGSLSNIKYGVIKNSAGKLLCWTRLSTAGFTVTDTNTLTIQFSGNGIFELNG